MQSQKDALKEANDMFNQGRYKETLIYLDRVDKVDNSAPLLFKRAICHFEVNNIDQALMDFRKAWEYGYKNDKTDYYLGLINHHKGEFREAATYYKTYLNHTPIESEDREKVRQLVKQCGRGIEIAYQKPIAIVENPGIPVNSQYDDFGWIESPNQAETYYFSTNRPNTAISMATGHHEIYEIKKGEDLKWTKPRRLAYPINSRSEEILTGITDESDGLIIYRKNEKKTSFIIYNQGSQSSKLKEIPIPGDFKEENAEVFFYNNDLILFAAKLPGGFGGYDIYSMLRENGHWHEPINLGPNINTPYDELTPYLVNEGNILYYSSNRSESVGGFDIFRTRYLYESRTWSPSENLSIPINSPGDELGFHLGTDGLQAAFSSSRKNAFGGRDIYFARFFAKQEGQEYYAGEVPFLQYEPLLAIENQVIDSLTEDIVTIEEETISVEETNVDWSLSPRKSEKYIIEPIFLGPNKEVLSKDNQTKLEVLTELMLIDDRSSIELISHTNSDGIVEYNLFSSLKIAERVKQYFIDKGIDQKRIYIKGFGDNYPFIKSEKDGGDIRLADAYNARLDFKMHQVPDNIEISYQQPVDINASMIDLGYDLFRAIIDESVTYKIEIATVQQMYRGMALSLFNDSAIEPDTETGLYSYTIGLYDSYAPASQTKRDLEREGLVNVKVIPYIDGLRIEEDQLVYYVNQYPDLKNFINYDNIIGSK